MTIILLWIVGSLLTGYLGRNRRAGFWGTFFFSLILSPIIGLLSLLLAAPSRQQKEKQAQAVRVAAEGRAAGNGNGNGHRREPMVTSVTLAALIPWLIVVAVFAVIYGTLMPSLNDESRWMNGLRLSVDMATLGLSGNSGVAATSDQRLLMALERLCALLVIAAAIVRVMARRSDARMSQMRTAIEQATASVGAMETLNRSQQEEINRLRTMMAQAPRVAESTTPASATH